jgi:hypothetical protein
VSESEVEEQAEFSNEHYGRKPSDVCLLRKGTLLSTGPSHTRRRTHNPFTFTLQQQQQQQQYYISISEGNVDFNLCYLLPHKQTT